MRIRYSSKNSKELINAYNNGDLESRDILIKHYMENAEEIAKEYYGLGVDKEDILSAASEGVIIVISSLQNKQCINLSSLVRQKVIECIEKEIIRSLGISSLLRTKTLKLRELTIRLSRKPTINEIIMENISSSVKKFELPSEPSENEMLSFQTIESFILYNVASQELIELVTKVSCLSEKEKYIVKSYLESKKFVEIARELGVSKQSVCNLWTTATAKLGRCYRKYFLEFARLKDEEEKVYRRII